MHRARLHENYTMRTNLLCAAAIAAVASTSLAQDLSVAQGNVAYTTAALTPDMTDPASADFEAVLGEDHAYEHWWFLRLPGDTRELPLRAAAPTVRTVAGNGSHFDSDCNDLEGRGLCRVRVDGDVYSTGAASGVLVTRLSVLNTTAAPLTISVFNYLDLDVNGSFGNDSAFSDDSEQVIVDPLGTTIRYHAFGADHGDLGVFPTLRNKLTNGVVDDLASDHTSILGGDYTGAFEWQDRVIPANTWVTFDVFVSIDSTVSAPARILQYGEPNRHAMEIHTDTLALQDFSTTRDYDVLLSGACAWVPCGLVSSLNPTQGLPLLGLQLWVDPTASIFAHGCTDGEGNAFLKFHIPPVKDLQGCTVYQQFFAATWEAWGMDWTGGMATQCGGLLPTFPQ